MKDKIIIFIIGILIGAIIATTGFLIYSKSVTNSDNNPQMIPNGQMGQPPEMQEGQEPPAKPDGDNGSEPPVKPEN